MGAGGSKRYRQIEEEYDKYILRWDYYPRHPAFFQGPAGTVVYAFKFYPKVHYVAHDTKEAKFMEDMVYVMAVNGCKGLIPVVFLQIYNDIGKPYTFLGNVLQQHMFKQNLIESKWHVPYVPFHNISVYMSENVVEAGSWLICNPQETQPTSDRWPDYWLAIKTCNGYVQKHIQIFKETYDHNKALATRVYLEAFRKDDSAPKESAPKEPVSKKTGQKESTPKEPKGPTQKDSVPKEPAKKPEATPKAAQKEEKAPKLEQKEKNAPKADQKEAKKDEKLAEKEQKVEEKQQKGKAEGKKPDESSKNETFLDEASYPWIQLYPKKLITDTFPGVAEPSPPVLFLRIRRTTTGRYYLFRQHEETFSTIYHLLDAYYGHVLPLDTSYSLILGDPVLLHSDPQPGIRPVDMPVPAPLRPMIRCIGIARTLLPVWKEKNEYANYGPVEVASYANLPGLYTFGYAMAETKKLSGISPVGQCSLGIVTMYGKKRKSVIKFIKSNDFIYHEQFLKDIMKLHIHTRKRQDFTKKEGHYYKPTGMNFLAKFHGCDITSERKWIGYERVGLYSLSEMMKLWTEQKKSLFLRAKLEIIYQIVCGMRHLEQNGLCHRNLKASNVIVKEDYDYNWSVVITDYMLPYSFLLNKSTKPIPYERLHWRWMAPESLTKGQFDIVSDVWAFGCTVFELMTWGKVPWYYDKDITVPADIIQKTNKGFLMTNDPKVPDYTVRLSEICMETDTKLRPSFHKLLNFLGVLLYDATKPVERTLYDNAMSKCKGSVTTGNAKTLR
ncbi:unnamed protein product [Bursaphelenchus okinawaensis]|uniref:Protein kinase domain-containing protein n=1 Tax=Bursaphelenchus okinawaensis TaxID=465554 RepID=A0A811KCD0_9BILA|nr:unnamed protein product [Bursaphelenchus okinawaensis]CAG9100837.1 unnamed protein product [Bursaphelenchus okinawaensis]